LLERSRRVCSVRSIRMVVAHATSATISVLSVLVLARPVLESSSPAGAAAGSGAVLGNGIARGRMGDCFLCLVRRVGCNSGASGGIGADGRGPFPRGP
jgi:hypothetical protein